MSTFREYSLKSSLINSLSYSREINLSSMIQQIFEDESGELPFQKRREYTTGIYNAMLTPLVREACNQKKISGNKAINTIIVHKDLNDLDSIVKDRAYILPVVTFSGKEKTNKNSRYIYSIVIDLDNVSINNLSNLIDKIESEEFPKPNILVNSGNGFHLYYNLIKPLPLYSNYTEIIQKLKTGILDLIWQSRVTTQSSKEAQLPLAITQGYRTIGSKTKFGATVKGWSFTEDRYSIEDLNSWTTRRYKLSKEEIDVLNGKRYSSNDTNSNNKVYFCHEGFYNKTLEGLLSKDNFIVGTRYNALRGLVITAKKSNIEINRLRNDLRILREHIISLTSSESFDETVIEDAIQNYYSEDALKIKRETLNSLTGLNFQPAKRNGRTRAEHLALIRSLPRKKREEKGRKEYKKRESKVSDLHREIVKYKKRHKSSTDKEIANFLSCSESTVRRVLQNRLGKRELLFIRTIKLVSDIKRIPTQKELVFYTGFSKGTISKYKDQLENFILNLLDDKKYLEENLNQYNYFERIFHENLKIIENDNPENRLGHCYYDT